MIKELSKFYQSYNTKHDKYGFVHHQSSKIKYFLNHIGEGKTILDLGCRDGSLTQAFIVNNNVVGLDVDCNACNLCRSNLNIEVVWHNLNEPLPLSDASYDIVILSDVLEHVFLDSELLMEIKRVLKPNGFCLGSTPNAYHWPLRVKMMRGIDLSEYSDKTHVHYYSFTSLERLLKMFFPSSEITPYGHSKLTQFYPTLFASDFFWKSIKGGQS